MRTTLTLDNDVYRRLESETRRTGRPFKEVVNEHLRRSLASARPHAQQPPFRVDAREMRLRPGLDVSNIHQLLDQLDGPAGR
jgi:hypothetical protein